MRTARTYPSAATIVGPTVTSRASRALRVELEIRSTVTRVVSRISVSTRGQEIGDCRDPRERARLVAAPEVRLFPVHRDVGGEERVRAARSGDEETTGVQAHAGLAVDRPLRAVD